MSQKQSVAEFVDKRMNLYDRVVQENNKNFEGIVSGIFDEINQKYGSRFKVECEPSWIAQEEMADCTSTAKFYYQYDNGETEFLGNVDAPAKGGLYRELELRFCASPSKNEATKDITGKFVKDCGEAFKKAEMPNARQEYDPQLREALQERKKAYE